MQLYILIRSLFPGALGYLWWVTPSCKLCGEAVDRDIFPPSSSLPLLLSPQTFSLLLFFPHCTPLRRQNQKSGNQRGKRVGCIVEALPQQVRAGRSAQPLEVCSALGFFAGPAAFHSGGVKAGLPTPVFETSSNCRLLPSSYLTFSVISGTLWGWCTVPQAMVSS